MSFFFTIARSVPFAAHNKGRCVTKQTKNIEHILIILYSHLIPRYLFKRKGDTCPHKDLNMKHMALFLIVKTNVYQQMNRKFVVYAYNGILLSNNRARTSDITTE